MIKGFWIGMLVTCIFACNQTKSKDEERSTLWLNGILLASSTSVNYSPTNCDSFSTPNDPYFQYQWHLENTGQAMYSSTQSAGVSGIDLKVKPVWQSGLSGKNSLVGIVDDGVVLDHEDLLPNVNAGSINFLHGTNGLATNDTGGSLANHGTSVAGIISARGGNAIGVTGVAPCSQFVAFNYLSKSTDSNMTTSLSSNKDVFVSNNSWGSEDGSGENQSAPSSFYSAIESGLANGRSGKGTSYVWAAGNGAGTLGESAGFEVDNSNFDGYARHYGIITVAGVLNNGTRASYSEKGANLWLSGFTGRDGVVNTAITSTDNIGARSEWGYNPGGGSTGFADTTATNLPNLKYTNGFNGTSAAAPQVSGVIALLLEKYPNLTWRDVKKILAKSATQINSGHSSWQTTNQSYKYSNVFGFGSVNAQSALQTAASWTSIGGSSSLKTFSYENTISHAITASSTFNIAIASSGITKIESIQIILTSNHPNPGEIDLELQPPAAQGSMKIEFHEKHTCYSGPKKALPTKNCSAMTNQAFGISGFLDYSADGTWRVTTKDTVSGNSGNITYYKIIFYGS
jgi:proprotein convertase subtilisin/kexin type 2